MNNISGKCLGSATWPPFNVISEKLRYHLDHLEEQVENRTAQLQRSNEELLRLKSRNWKV